MQYKQTLTKFVNAMTEYVENNMDGSIVIMGNDDGWGKLIIEDSEIVSINYGIFRGIQVLEQLEKLTEIRFMFRPSKTPVSNDKKAYANAGSARMSNASFFEYFGVSVPHTNNSSNSITQLSATAKKPKDSMGALRNKVLIIDDSVIARKAAADPLAEYGFEVLQAKDGFDALGQLEKELPDMIILDLIMPGMDGYKVVDLLKRNEKFKKLPIIMVTSKDSLMDKVKGKMSPTDAYITKPFKEDDLLKTVLKVLGKRFS